MPMRFIAIAALALAACATTTTPVATPTPAPAAQESAQTESNQTMQNQQMTAAAPAAPTVEEATQFVNDAEARLAALNVEANRASWVQSTFITPDTQALAARANELLISAGVELAKGAARFDQVEVPYDVRRKLETIKLSLTSPGPADPALTAEMTRIASDLEAAYGSGKYCPPGKSGDDCLRSEERRVGKECRSRWSSYH